MSEKPIGNLEKCPIDGELFEKIPTTKIYCSAKCKKVGDSENRRQRKAAVIAEAERKRDARNARRRKQVATHSAVVKIGGQRVACSVISQHFFGLFTKVSFPAQLDFGYPAFPATKIVPSWKVSE